MPNPKEQFIADLYPAARRIGKETGMSWELILAQAALETGWGEKVLSGTNNIFNIKADAGWQGESKEFRVPEFINGKWVQQIASFRVYTSTEEALRDRIEFLRDNPRYARSGLFDEDTKGDLRKEAEALQKAGYATDPAYAEKLAEIFGGRTMRNGIALANSPIDEGQSADQATPATQAGRYTITESVGNRVEPVSSFEDLEKHHPSRGREPGRQYQEINGELEEVRVRNGTTFIKKDFILSQNTAGSVQVPAPAAGYIHHLNDVTNAVRIYDKPYGTEGAVMIAQSLHMTKGTTPPEGSRIEYGQPMGNMGEVGSPGSIHAHVETDLSRYQQYIRDIVEGRIRPGMTQGIQEQSPAQNAPSQTAPTQGPHSNTPASQTAGLDRLPPMPPVESLQPGASGAAVFALQQHLRLLNARDAEGNQIKVDRDYGPRTGEAVENFQLWSGLPTTGIADRTTLDVLKVHAAYALEQRAKGIPQAEHLADNLNPAIHSPASAVPFNVPQQARDRTVGEQGHAKAPLTYSHPDHSEHGLYARLVERLDSRGQLDGVFESQLVAMAGRMHHNGFKPDWEGDAIMRNGRIYAQDVQGHRTDLALSEQVPPPDQTMRNVQAEDLRMAQIAEASRQQDQLGPPPPPGPG